MRYGTLFAVALPVWIAACQAQPSSIGGATSGEERVAADGHAPAAPPTAVSPAVERSAPVELQALARRTQGEESICRAFAREVAEAALQHGNDSDAFLAALQDEFIGGSDNPFDMKVGLQEGSWNQRYVYAGHGGFLPELDDAQRYPHGGNHQPGHFVSVLSIAARFGEEQARIAIAYAGDYDEGEEDDLRLSLIAIPLGAGLRDGSTTTAEVAQQVRGLCR